MKSGIKNTDILELFMSDSKPGRYKQLAAKVIFAALQVLKEKGSQAPGREVVQEVGKRIQLDDWAKEVFSKTGNIRWQSLLHLFSIDCTKTGYLLKK